ncbi:MAG TPA: phosphatidate cytidylyltransferase [Candidatus Saccharimonadia bacterium]|jgi:phosphatidate cytidylyltransferase|nr:phosphatidate cytidylyltransferase [Candidatus Saccharimonadia bacterium]
MLSAAAVPLGRLVALFAALMVAGTLLTVPLFRFDLRRFVRSTLFVKIVLWAPIFVVFVAMLYAGNAVRFSILAVLAVMGLTELVVVLRRAPAGRVLAIAYFCGWSVALLHFFALAVVFASRIVPLLIVVCFASVLGDVAAFFMGNYLGKHKLPKAFNDRKSWEGVAGQVMGAVIGVWLVNAVVTPVPVWWLWLPVGVGSAAGDLTNSFVKRRLGIKDWSQNIPGHGGYLDRLSSLAGSGALTFWALFLTR